MDGRFVLLGFVVVIAGVTARNLQPVRSAGAVAAERAVDAVLVDVDHTQLCYFRRRGQYADTIPSLQFAGGRFMRPALQNDLDITLATRDKGRSYEARVSGFGVKGVLARRGTDLVRLGVGDRPRPPVSSAC